MKEGEEEEEEEEGRGERRDEGRRERKCVEKRANIPLKCSKVAGRKRRGAKPTCPFSCYLRVCVTLRQTQQ